MNPTELAELVVSTVSEAGSDTVFGLPGGGANLEVIGAAQRRGLRFVLTHAETAAVIMAGVYSDLVGAPTMCVVTRGPGAASAVNGTAQARLDRQAAVLITDTVNAADRARIAHQALDQIDLLTPAAKRSVPVGGPGTSETLRAALNTALRAPRGPIHLDFDPSAAAAVVSPPEAMAGRRLEALPEAGLDLLRASRKPLLLLGAGARDCVDEVRALVKATGTPVLTTYRARGVIPDSWPEMAGTVIGGVPERTPISEADLLIAVGLDTVELIPAAWPYTAPLLTLGEFPEPTAYLRPDVDVVGDLARLMPQLLDSFPASGWPPGWAATMHAREVELLHGIGPQPTRGLAPQDVVTYARELAPVGAIATVDAGVHMLVAMAMWECDDLDELLISSGLATMGYALPAAIAAALARPDRRVVCFVGDGGLGMSVAELETAARLALPIVVVVFNDSGLSLIAVKQHPTRHGDEQAVRYDPIDYARVAEGLGLVAHRVDTVEAYESALRAGFERVGPTLIDVQVDSALYDSVYSVIRG